MRALAGSLLLAVLLAAPGLRAARPAVLLDPGHGGSDRGAEQGGLAEAELALDLAKRVQALLKARGVEARLTRDADRDLSLTARVELANSLAPRALLSLHFNAAWSPALRGPRLFVPPASTPDIPEAPPWAQASGPRAAASRALGAQLAKALGAGGPRPVQTLKLGLFRGLAAPACLVELEYLSHPEARKALKREADLQALAAKLTQGLLAWLGGSAGGEEP